MATERLESRLRVWRIDPGTRALVEIGQVPVLQGAKLERAMPMGIAIYQRASDQATFAIVSPKTGDSHDYLAQYRLLDDGRGGVRGDLVRRFGAFSGVTTGAEGENEIEAVAVDDVLGYVYYADEHAAIRKYAADPDAKDAGRELASFGTTGFAGQREGIGIYSAPDGTGYIVCTDQVPGESEYRVFRREGRPGHPHDHGELVAVLAGGAESTDGIEVTASALGPRFPAGALVAMNSIGRNFFYFRWDDVQRALR